MEWRLFSGAVPYVSTAEFHADRERARHLEEEWSQPRLSMAADFVRQAVSEGCSSVTDLGCGDGGLLSVVQGFPGVSRAWGYDFCPANEEGWNERGVEAYRADVFNTVPPQISVGDVAVMTEVLEHLADPHGSLEWIRRESRYLVCSSPWNEKPGMHCLEHAWAWNPEGYASMIRNAGWNIVRHEQASLFQVVLAR